MYFLFPLYSIILGVLPTPVVFGPVETALLIIHFVVSLDPAGVVITVSPVRIGITDRHMSAALTDLLPQFLYLPLKALYAVFKRIHGKFISAHTVHVITSENIRKARSDCPDQIVACFMSAVVIDGF